MIDFDLVKCGHVVKTSDADGEEIVGIVIDIALAVVIDQTQRNLQAKMALQARNENK